MKIAEIALRVRYQETDAMGVVYYGNYFTWFEVARTEFLKELGLSYRRMEEDGLRLMVVDASCHYKAPCRYDDVIRIQTWVSEMRTTSLAFEYKVFFGQRLLANGRTAHVFTNASLKPTRIPQGLRGALTGSGRA
jgi:acyl-CoA thioester hydrolase